MSVGDNIDVEKTNEAGSQSKRRPKKGLRGHPNVVAVILSVVFAILIRTFVFQSFYIPSGSMIPTLKIGDRIVVSKLSFALSGVQRGDIIVFARPPADIIDPNIHDLVKRVVGMPGDTISTNHGHVIINGHILKEPYLPSGDSTYNIPFQTVPSGEYFMMGDNRGDSYDSRYFGDVSGKLFIGKVVLRFYPFSRFAAF